MPSQAEFTRKRGCFIRADFQEASILKKYHGEWYSEDSWSDTVHQNFEIKTALAFTVKDIRTEISKYKRFKHVIQELSYTNQWGIYPLNCYHEIKCVYLFQAVPIGKLPLEIPLKKVE